MIICHISRVTYFAHPPGCLHWTRSSRAPQIGGTRCPPSRGSTPRPSQTSPAPAPAPDTSPPPGWSASTAGLGIWGPERVESRQLCTEHPADSTLRVSYIDASLSTSPRVVFSTSPRSPSPVFPCMVRFSSRKSWKMSIEMWPKKLRS